VPLAAMNLPDLACAARRVSAVAASLWFRCRCLVESKPAGETYLKSDGELMEILNAYDLTGSYRGAAELCGARTTR